MERDPDCIFKFRIRKKLAGSEILHSTVLLINLGLFREECGTEYHTTCTQEVHKDCKKWLVGKILYIKFSSFNLGGFSF